MVKLQFKQKCRKCKLVWVLVKSREAIICAPCKVKYEKSEVIKKKILELENKIIGILENIKVN